MVRWWLQTGPSGGVSRGGVLLFTHRLPGTVSHARLFSGGVDSVLYVAQ